MEKYMDPCIVSQRGHLNRQDKQSKEEVLFSQTAFEN